MKGVETPDCNQTIRDLRQFVVRYGDVVAAWYLRLQKQKIISVDEFGFGVLLLLTFAIGYVCRI